ncbi:MULTISPECIES: lactate utilization protein C [Sporomusa]|uniref:LutC/YkgG family protein n=1 Tax=Sporomusa TaxID=2375 RepID=UPI00166484A0|nr:MULTISPECIES: lactate utilization protein C [Sporomusa]MCM0757063.1 lactate utilization protein C [Sporomusa sphaeroides DSM 2875]HML31375.1 lactate utilization protein C [Sporomusa sphaeroides]
MKKVSENWTHALTSGTCSANLFPEFETRAKNAAAEVFRVKTAAEAKEVIANLVKYTNARKVVAVDSPLQQAAGINATLTDLGVSLYTEQADIAEHAESADIGISAVEFGIAESGSVCQDALAFESRLVSMLPPLHIVFMNSNRIVPGITEAMETIAKVYDRGYISFITGPSRTADIERVLTIGVHGPSRFVIIAVDEEVNGGKQ